MPGGKVGRVSFAQSRRICADSRLSVSRLRDKRISTAGLPRKLTSVCALLGRRLMVAISPSVSRRPSCATTIGRSVKASSRRRWSLKRNWRADSPRPMMPTGKSREAAPMRRPMSSSDRPSSRSLPGGTWMAISSSGSPKMRMLEMPRSSSSRSKRCTRLRRPRGSFGPVTSRLATIS